MLTIYSIPVSIYCAKLRLVLRCKNLQWHEVSPLGGYKSTEFKTIVPSGNLPTMVDGDLMLADSEAIAEYLNERYPFPPMLSDNIEVRAKQRELGRFHDTRLEPELRVLFPYVAKSNRDRKIAIEQGKNISARLQQLAGIRAQCNHSSDPVLSLGDCGFVATFEWIDMLANEMDFSVDWPEEITAYRNWLQGIDVVQQEMSSYRPEMDIWLQNTLLR